MISTIGYDENEVTEYDDVTEVRTADGVLWAHATGPSQSERRALAQTFDIHPPSIEDIRDTTRAKTEEYPAYTFVLLKAATLTSDEPSLAEEIETHPVGIFIGSDWLLTYSVEPVAAVERVQQRVRTGESRLKTRGADFAASQVANALVDGYINLLDQLEDRIEDIEETAITSPDPEKHVLRTINHIRRELLVFGKLARPAQRAVGVLARGESEHVREDTEKYYRDVYDYLEETVTLTETYQDLAAGAGDLYLNALSESTNELMATLTIVATIVLPLTLVVGWFGMNFRSIPEFNWPFAYPAVVIGMVGITLVLVVYFERQGYL